MKMVKTRLSKEKMKERIDQILDGRYSAKDLVILWGIQIQSVYQFIRVHRDKIEAERKRRAQND